MFLPSDFFIEIFVTNPKVNIHSKIQSQSQHRSDFFLLLFLAVAKLQPFILVHTDLASIFNIMTALHAGKQPDFFAAFVPFPTFFSPQPLRPTTQISRLLCSSVVANSKICRGRSRNSSVVESQGYFVLERPFLQFHEQQAKFANEVSHLTRFFEKVDSQLPSRLMMLIRQPLKMKNGCELTKNRRYTIFEPLLQLNEAK